MEQLNTYITEKFRLRDDTKLTKQKSNANDKYEPDKEMRKPSAKRIKLYNGKGKSFMIPDKCWYVFKDQYRLKQYKIECYVELAANIMYASDDYENFGPNDIEYATNSLQDAMRWVLSQFIKPGTEEIFDELFLYYDYYDSDEWVEKMEKVMTSDYAASFNFHTVWSVLEHTIQPVEFANYMERGVNLEKNVGTFDDFKQTLMKLDYNFMEYI